LQFLLFDNNVGSLQIQQLAIIMAPATYVDQEKTFDQGQGPDDSSNNESLHNILDVAKVNIS